MLTILYDKRLMRVSDMVVSYENLVPEPKSRFVNVVCSSCDSPSVIFTMTKSAINCKFCGNVITEPTGGQAKIFGRLQGIVDDLPHIIIKTITPDSKKILKKLLLDSMIIHKMINNSSGQIFVNDVSNYNLCLIVLDRILIETIHMEKQEYDVSLTKSDIIEKLERVGPVETIQVDHASLDMIAARELCDSRKYVNSDDVGLSATDCMLLQMHLKGAGDLLTHDKTLINAAEREGRPLTYDCVVFPN